MPCTCDAGPCALPPPDPIYLGADVPGGEWSSCPHGALRHPMLATVLRVDDLASVSPLSGWPDTYAAGVVDCLLALRIERAVEQTRRAKK